MNNKDILWIENQFEYAEPQLQILRKAGYNVKTATTTDLGLEYLIEKPDYYDLIILDILLGEKPIQNIKIPNGKSGLILYSLFRDKYHYSKPIVFLTVIVDNDVLKKIADEESQRGFQSNIWQKPIRPSDLLKKVEKILSKNK